MAPKNTSKNPALAVLRIVSKMIAGMSQQELESLASGRTRLTIAQPSGDQGVMFFDRAKDDVIDFDDIQRNLSAAESTEAGFKILDKVRLSRAELEKMARSLDLPVMKQDSVGRLEEKIVEALIGSRLNSRAVRGR